MMAKGERGIPVQDGRCTEAIFGKRIRYDVSRSVNRPALKRESPTKGRRFTQGVGFEGSVRLWKLYCSIHGLSQRVQRGQRIQRVQRVQRIQRIQRVQRVQRVQRISASSSSEELPRWPR